MDDNPGIWRQVFSDTAQAIAFFGALGGFTHALVFKRDWRETIRLTLIGCATSFGFGIMSWTVLRTWFPGLPSELGTALPILTSGAFFFGLVSLYAIESMFMRLGKGQGGRDDSPEGQ